MDRGQEINSHQILLGRCWACEVDLIRDIDGWSRCQICRRRFRVQGKHIWERTPATRFAGQKECGGNADRVVLADGSIKLLDRNTLGFFSVPPDAIEFELDWSVA